jgi:hypothetical protein
MSFTKQYKCQVSLPAFSAYSNNPLSIVYTSSLYWGGFVPSCHCELLINSLEYQLVETLVGMQPPRRPTAEELLQLNQFFEKEGLEKITQPIIVPYHSMSYGTAIYRSQLFKKDSIHNAVSADFLPANKSKIRTYFGYVRFFFSVKHGQNEYSLAFCQWVHQTGGISLGEEFIPTISANKFYSGDSIVNLSQLKSRIIFIPLHKVSSKYKQNSPLCAVIDMSSSIVDEEPS